MGQEPNRLTDISSLDPGFSDEVAALPGGANIKKCFACGTCAAGCPVTAVHPEYNCRTIIRQVLLGMRSQVLQSKELWYCIMCYRCHARCPQQVNFTDIMRALRYLAVKAGYAPDNIYTTMTGLETDTQAERSHRITETVQSFQTKAKA